MHPRVLNLDPWPHDFEHWVHSPHGPLSPDVAEIIDANEKLSFKISTGHHRTCQSLSKNSEIRSLSVKIQKSEGIKVYTQIIPEYVVYLHKPDVTALQLTAQPGLEPLASVLKCISTVLLLLLISAGREDPQLFSIKVVPSPSVIVRWS